MRVDAATAATGPVKVLQPLLPDARVVGELERERAARHRRRDRVAGVEAGRRSSRPGARAAPIDARYTRRRRPARVESVSVVPVMRHRPTRSSRARYVGSTLPAAPATRDQRAHAVVGDGHARPVGGVRAGCSRCTPSVPLTRVPSKTAFTATPSSGVPIDTRSVSTQFVPAERCRSQRSRRRQDVDRRRAREDHDDPRRRRRS